MQTIERRAALAPAGRATADQTPVALLKRAGALVEQAMREHIYDKANGEAPGPDCAFAAYLADLQKALARPAALPLDVLSDGLRLIAAQSVCPDWTHQQAFEFMRASAREHLAAAAVARPPKLVLVVSGGNVQSMHGSRPFPSMDIVLIDHDHLGADGRSEDECEAIEASEIAACPQAVLWDVGGNGDDPKGE